MDDSRKCTLILTLTIVNAVFLVLIAGSQVAQRQGVVARFRGVEQFNQSVLDYRRASEKLEEERWSHLMHRLDELDKKVFDSDLKK